MIVVALVLDAADQTLLATFTAVDTTETGSYQSVDKALDIYYLSIAYLATMRNWTSNAAFRIAQFLFYYRLVGGVLFELSDSRVMLLLFPNRFEYFFIVYELVRLRYEPSRLSARFWLLAAAGLWVFVKLPQEYWIHIAKLDFTDAVRDSPAFGVAVVLALLIAAFMLVRVVYPRLPAPDWGWRLGSDRLPSSLVEAHARYARRLESGRVLTREAFEQVCLLALLCIIFASILPGIDATVLQVVLGVAAIVLANAAISLAAARRGGFGRRDLDLFLDVSDPAVEWHSSISVIAEGGAYHGHDGIRQYMSDVVEAFDLLHATLDRTLDVGDLVVGVGRLHYRGKASGVDSVVPMGWIFKFREGKLIYLRAFREPEQALEAVGLRE